MATISGQIPDNNSWFLNEIQEFYDSINDSAKAMEALDVLSFLLHCPSEIDLSVDITDIRQFVSSNWNVVESVFNNWKEKKEFKYGFAEWRTLNSFKSFTILVTEEDKKLFFDTIENPREPNKALKEAYKNRNKIFTDPKF